ncbi:MAG TPA: DUF72 domain-containing protein [Gemmatimonadaceae bacterium]|nr:DUF72 domain-containing protein [Gemmatimonadaceae bacterium]
MSPDAPTPPAVDTAHDPGVDAARARAEATGLAGTPVLTAPGGGRIRIGTAGWTDPTLTAPGVFYPDGTSSPEARLRHYADVFPMVEVDAPFYALPTARMAELWARRTPDDFVFDVKAHALMTGHPTEVKRLPTVLRDALPKDVAAKGRIYPKDVPADVMDAVWGGFVDALQPLAAAGKLGAVLLQYPRWFVPGAPARDELLRARERLEGLPLSVEFRARSWFAPTTAEHTLRFLADHDLPFVMVDEPQGLRSSVPPVVAVTSPRLSVVRMHGRRGDQWERRGATVAEKYRYLYDREELAEWAPKIVEAAGQSRETHVVFNNCYANYGTTNALEMGALLAAAT